MKLTDEKILELVGVCGLAYQTEYNTYVDPYIDGTNMRPFIIDFARAVLKEAGVEEFEPVAWMADSEQRFLSKGASAFVSAHNRLERADGIVLYKKTKAK